MIEVRQEQPGDAAAIREVNRRAFGQEVEGRIVDALRANGGVVLSLVAAIDDRVVGHVIYSPAVVGDVVGAALGPMAVTPDCQRQGIGSRLVEAAHQHLKRADCPFIVVVGHPAFYPRFGFKPARGTSHTTRNAMGPDRMRNRSRGATPEDASGTSTASCSATKWPARSASS